jgi:hypothetical protein
MTITRTMGNLLERQKLAYQNMFYSIQRIDLLIISISGAGIYVCFETIKYLSSKELPTTVLVKVAGGLFLFGIIVNFISQLTSYKTNREDYLKLDVELQNEEEITDEVQLEIDNHDQSSDKFDRWTQRLNLLSMFLMFGGLIILATYFIFIF